MPEIWNVDVAALGKAETSVLRNYCEYVVARANFLAQGAITYETLANTFFKSSMDSCPPGSKCDTLNRAIRVTLPRSLSELEQSVEVGRVRSVCGSPVLLPSFTSGNSVVLNMARYAQLAGTAAKTFGQFTSSEEFRNLKNLGSAAVGVLGPFAKLVGLGGGSILTNDQIEARLGELAALPEGELEARLSSARALLESGIDANAVQSVTSVLAYMLNSCSGADALGAEDGGEEEIPELEPVTARYGSVRGYGSAGGDSVLSALTLAGGTQRPKIRSLWGGALYSPPRLVGGAGSSARRGGEGPAPTVAQQAVAMGSMKTFYDHMGSSGMCGSPIIRLGMTLFTGVGALLIMQRWTPTVVWNSIAGLLWSYQNGTAAMPTTWTWSMMFGQFLAGVEGTTPKDSLFKQIVYSMYLLLNWAYTQVQFLIAAVQLEYSLTGKLHIPQPSSDDVLKMISLYTAGKWSLSMFTWVFKVVALAMVHLGDFFCKALATGAAMSLEALFKTLHLPSLGQRLWVVGYSNWLGRERGEELMAFYEGLNAKHQKELMAIAARRAAEDMDTLAASLGIRAAEKKALDAKLAAAARQQAEAAPKNSSPKKKSPNKSSPKKKSPKKKASPKKASPKRRARQ